MIKFEDIVDELNKADRPSRDSQPSDRGSQQQSEPAWLRSTAPGSPKPPSTVAEPIWLRRLALVDSARATNERSNRKPSKKDRKRGRSEKGPRPKAQAADRSGRLIVLALAVVAGVLLLCLIALISIARSPIFAATLNTATPRKVDVFVAATWPATWTATPGVAITPTVAAAKSGTPIPNLKTTPIAFGQAPSSTSQYIYRTVYNRCQYAAGTFVEGTVTNTSGQVAGSHVALGAAPGGQVLQTAVTGGEEDPGYYAFTLRWEGPLAGTFYVWVTDASGKPLSDPSLGRFVTNGIENPADPGSCWLAFIDFVSVR